MSVESFCPTKNKSTWPTGLGNYKVFHTSSKGFSPNPFPGSGLGDPPWFHASTKPAARAFTDPVKEPHSFSSKTSLCTSRFPHTASHPLVKNSLVNLSVMGVWDPRSLTTTPPDHWVEITQMFNPFILHEINLLFILFVTNLRGIPQDLNPKPFGWKPVHYSMSYLALTDSSFIKTVTNNNFSIWKL